MRVRGTALCAACKGLLDACYCVYALLTAVVCVCRMESLCGYVHACVCVYIRCVCVCACGVRVVCVCVCGVVCARMCVYVCTCTV